MRQAGILMPISALPTNSGIGDFGSSAYRWIDDLAKAQITIWQILPLHPLGYGNSPYQPYSSFALDERYVDLDDLHNRGWIAKPKALPMSERVDFEAVKTYKRNYLEEAFANHTPSERWSKTVKQAWLKPFAAFMAYKDSHLQKPWTQWEPSLQRWPHPIEDAAIQERIKYHIFVQCVLFEQWQRLHAYAKKKGVLIMGDMPFYIGLDSADVWSHPDDFLLNEHHEPTFVAGVPPDYFSATGQRWGNPIYDWGQMKKNNYSFWLHRVEGAKALYDILRIDHFRAFDTYWKIPASCPTAVEGTWQEAPGYEVLDALVKAYPDFCIVAEDLGDLRPEVLTLRDHYRLKGMKVLEFTFSPYGDPDPAVERIVYTGTHDNQTIVGWYQQNDVAFQKSARAFFRKRGIDPRNIADAFVKLALADAAEWAILPVQDVLGLDDAARINEPGTIQSTNWSWRLATMKQWEKRIPVLRRWIKQSER